MRTAHVCGRLDSVWLVSAAVLILAGDAFGQEPFRFSGSAGLTRIEVVQEADELVLSLQGREAHRWRVGGSNQVSTREARVGRRRIGIVDVQSGTRAYTALVDGRTLRWTGRTDAHGDPGERVRDVLQIADRTGDGVDDLIVGRVIEGRSICGHDETLLDPRAIHPRTGRLTSVTLRRLEETNSADLTAAAEALVDRPPLLRLQATGASSAAGHDASLAPPPVALVDGDGSTAWIEASAGDGTWEFVTFRWPSAEVPVQALSITTAEVEGASAPTGVTVVFDDTRVHVALPEGPGPWWVRLPEPVSTRCLSLVLDGARSGTHAALGEVAAYADVDFGQGLETWIGRLAGGGREASQAAELLAAIGEPVLPLLDARWSDMPSAEKRIVVGIFARHANHELGAQGLLRAALDADAEVRTAAVERAIAVGAVDALGQMVVIAGEPGDRAALAFARRAPNRIDVLLDAMSREGGAARPALREAIRTAMQRGGEASAVDVWLGNAGPEARSAVAMALARGGEDLHRVAHGALVTALDGAEAFEVRWRSVAAASVLPQRLDDRNVVDSFLRTQATAEEWMMRAAALEALAERGSPNARATAEAAMSDEYPRVRVAALAAFKTLGSGPLREIGVAARRDPWPMVRAAGVDALGSAEEVRPIIRAAVRDPASLVRARALALLDPNNAEDWALVIEVLNDDDEWPRVIRAGLAAASQRCNADSIPALTAVAERGLRPSPWAPDVEVGAEAVEIAARIGGREAQRLIERAADPVAPAPYRNAAERADQAESCR